MSYDLDPTRPLGTALATPDIADQYPHQRNQHRTDENDLSNEYANRIHQDELAVHRVEPIETANGRWQREQIIFRHRKGVFMRMILGSPRKCVPGRVQLDMAAQHETDRAILYKGCDSPCTGKVGASVIDKQTRRHQKVTGKE